MSNATAVSDIEREEHDKTFGVKKTRMYAYDGSNLVGAKSDSDGHLQVDVLSESITSSEEALLLRRIVKLLESNAVVDYANRQKIIVEGAVITSGTITTVGSLSNIVANGGVDPRYQFMDAARLAYADGIRNNLSFT